MCHMRAIAEHITKSCKHKTLVLPFEVITKEMSHPEYAVLGSSHTLLGAVLGIREMEVAIDAFALLSISVLGVLVHLSFILAVVLCSEVICEAPVFPLLLATTTNQVFYLQFPVVSMTVVRLHPPSRVLLIAPVS